MSSVESLPGDLTSPPNDSFVVNCNSSNLTQFYELFSTQLQFCYIYFDLAINRLVPAK